MLFKPVSEVQYRSLIRDSCSLRNPNKAMHSNAVAQLVFHLRIAQIESDLSNMNAQHDFQRPSLAVSRVLEVVRSNEILKEVLGNDFLETVEKFRPASAAGVGIGGLD